MKTPAATKVTTSAPNSAKFTGTDNPRHLRAITALLHRPMPRENLTPLPGAPTAPSWWPNCAAVGWNCRASASTLLTATGSPAALACIS